MNKEDFYYIQWFTSEDAFIEGYLAKSQIEGIYKDPLTGKAIIALKSDSIIRIIIRIEKSYEDTLIDLFNESIPNNSISR